MAVLDTTFLIAVEKKDPKAMEVLGELRVGRAVLRVPAAAWTEYLSSMRPARRHLARGILMTSTVFEPFGLELADAAAALQYELQRDGMPLGWHDLQIAATALHHRDPVVSNDGVFRRVPGLETLPH